ncbi:2151_t:CDS:2 [Cetraspora pellucida]|uniref:2151_t:CDS:1 n=1 Tax=Cetraspora pellucida TaxID=1433469 RepID=A0A9N9BR19_9GLOM|nr:2151_t:CDS:2 [Cetraspora pellucida]
MFQEAFRLTLNKFNKHIIEHSALKLNSKFNEPNNILINEWRIYCNENEIFEENFDLEKY